MTAEKNSTTINSVDRTFDIIEELQTTGIVGVSELAEAVDLPRSTAYNYLRTLRERGYVVKVGDRYRLGNRFVHLGDSIKHQRPVFQVAKTSIDLLAVETGETANLMVEEGGRGFYLMCEAAKDSLQNYSHVRRREYLHSTAAGKAILSELPRTRVEEIIDRVGLPALTEQTITDRDELFATLEEVAERGYACNDEENREGIRAVGAPIVKPDGPVGAVSLSGAVNRVTCEMLHEDHASKVRDAAKSIEVEHRP